MEKNKIKVTLLPHTHFIKEDGTFDKEEVIRYCAKIAGECYEEEGWEKLKDEPIKRTLARIQRTLDLEHFTPYEHVQVGFEIINLPKILAMILNNEKQCATSEKSARYTKINAETDSNVSPLEGELYDKWFEKFKIIIKKDYGHIHNDSKIKTLAQENARYLVSVFASTKMIHTVPWIQLNRIISYMHDYTKKTNVNDFDARLIESFKEFIKCFEDLNVLDERAMSNRKSRSLSLFSDEDVQEDEFGYTYAMNYDATFAQLAQAHRHRTLDYTMHLHDEKTYFVPPILEYYPELKEEWLHDIESVGYAFPQGEFVSVNEYGRYDKFILKAKERLCAAAQQEVMVQTKDNLTVYQEALEEANHPLASDIEKYTHGARCTFSDYECAKPCGFKEAITLERKI